MSEFKLPSRQELLAYLKGRNNSGRIHTETGHSGPQAKLTCPSCGKARTLAVALEGDAAGGFICYHCDAKGGWKDLPPLFGDPEPDIGGHKSRPAGANSVREILQQAVGERLAQARGTGRQPNVAPPTFASGWEPPVETASGQGESTRAVRERTPPKTEWGFLGDDDGGTDTDTDPDTGEGADDREEVPRSGGRDAFAFDPELGDRAHARLRSPEGEAVLRYLREVRRLTDEAIEVFQLGAFRGPLPGRPDEPEEVEYLVIPILSDREEVVNYRFRPIPAECPVCSGKGCPPPADDRRPWCREGQVAKQFLRCRGRPGALFGAHLLPDRDSAIVVVEGELDVISLYAMGVTVGVVSSTEGATGSWRDEWLDLLEPYSGYIMAHDDDDPGDKGAAKLAEKLGRIRCTRAKMPAGCKDAGEALAMGLDPADVIDALFRRAKPMITVELCRIGDFREEFLEGIRNPEKLKGIPAATDRTVTQAMGGWRPGVWIVTGDTGHGKTTWLTWELHGLAKQGHGVLLTAFEQRSALLMKLLRQDLGGDFLKLGEAGVNASFDRLDRLPFVFMKRFGHISPAELVEAIAFAARRLGVRFVMVDHVGFVVDEESDDERRHIEACMRALITVADAYGVTIFLVAHPNRGHIGQGGGRTARSRVTMKHLKGASALEQDAEGVVVVVRNDPKAGGEKGSKVLHFTTDLHFDKVRSEFGVPGSTVTLYFDRRSCRYAGNLDALPAVPRVEGAEDWWAPSGTIQKEQQQSLVG